MAVESTQALWLKSGRRVKLKIPPSVSRLSRKCGRSDYSQAYRRLLPPVTGIALLFKSYRSYANKMRVCNSYPSMISEEFLSVECIARQNTVSTTG
jgi:hypothetical protein